MTGSCSMRTYCSEQVYACKGTISVYELIPINVSVGFVNMRSFLVIIACVRYLASFGRCVGLYI